MKDSRAIQPLGEVILSRIWPGFASTQRFTSETKGPLVPFEALFGTPKEHLKRYHFSLRYAISSHTTQPFCDIIACLDTIFLGQLLTHCLQNVCTSLVFIMILYSTVFVRKKTAHTFIYHLQIFIKQRVLQKRLNNAPFLFQFRSYAI